MLVSLILGMGMPSVAVYVVISTLLGHGLKYLGSSLLAAHLFIFYFAVISNLTPPVAVAAYAGAAIARSDPWKTGLIAFRFALSGFIVPYCFIYGPALLMEGTWLQIAHATTTASLGILSLSMAAEGWFLTSFKHWFERVILLVAAILMIHIGFITDAIGMALLVGQICLQISRARKWEPILAKGRAILKFGS
jgi:TRAP-type uncharacterized transport system fused permease subunit